MMIGTPIMCLLFISGFSSFTSGSSDFHFVDVAKSYAEAKTFCREMYTDLATVRNSSDMDNLIALVPSNIARAWIGLENGDVWMWHWSLPDQRLDFLNWKAGEPQNTNQYRCAAMNPGGEWSESDCDTKRSFVCEGSNHTTGHIFVAEVKSWRAAQDHCRNLLTDLVSIQSAEENEAVQNVSLSQTVWIGLFKDPWKWSDGSNSSFRYWKPQQPNNHLNNQDCVAAIFRDRGRWNDLICDGRRRFICQGAEKSTTTPATPTQTSSEPALTTSEVTTMNATEQVSSQSTELTSATTETVTVTETQRPLPTTTMQITTDSSTALTTLVGTSSYTTAESSTPMPSQNIQEKLILIQENMTWSEALSYCRDNHIDLVHVTTKEIQERVAEKAKNATSSHVWLGLRYTCSFNFWFWIREDTSCYQNWAPGQGPDRQYGCGTTGAIEATGGQQWVGLPEKEKLNFICFACAEMDEGAL